MLRALQGSSGIALDDIYFGRADSPGFFPDIALLSAQLGTTNATIEFTYEMTGWANNPYYFSVAVYQSSDTSFDASDTMIGGQFLIPPPRRMNMRGTATISLPYPLPVDPSTPFLILVADPLNIWPESNPNNNIQAIAWQSIPNADIVPISLSWNTNQGGADFSYKVTGATLATNSTAALYWANGPTIYDILAPATAPIIISAATPVGQSQTVHLTPTDFAGNPPPSTKYLLAVVDPDNLINEGTSGENNNVKELRRASSLTVLTHGFQLSGNMPEWPLDMARAINSRMNSLYTDQQILNSVGRYGDPNSNLDPPADGADGFLIYDWAARSNDWGTADDANVAGRLAALIRRRLPTVGTIDIHFIGHSRGSYVNAAAIELLNNDIDNAKIGRLQMTTLDPQNYGDDGAGNEDGRLLVPTNVDWADNYYQIDDRDPDPFSDGILGGGRLIGPSDTTLNLDITFPLLQWQAVSGLFDDHSETHYWYHWTVDLEDSYISYNDQELDNQRSSGLNRSSLFGWFKYDIDHNGTPDDVQNGRLLGFYWSQEAGGSRPELPLDSDGDGVPDDEESGSVPGGDANHDGIPDSQQANIATIRNSDDGRYVILESPTGTRLTNASTSVDAGTGGPPGGIDFPFGFLRFEVAGITPGTGTTVRIWMPEVVPLNTVRKYGPTPDNSDPHWYGFAYDGATGARIYPGFDFLDLILVDGQRGDSDGMANGVIVDPVAMGYNPIPIVTAGEDVLSVEGAAIRLRGEISDRGETGQTTTWIIYDSAQQVCAESNDPGFTFVPRDSGIFRAVFTAVDSDGGTGTDELVIGVNNIPPTASITGPTDGVRGQPQTFTFGALDPSPTDQGQGFAYRVHWGDGTPDQVIDRTPGNGAGTTVDHVFTEAGSFLVTVTATDKDDGTSVAATQTINLGITAIQTDADGMRTLVVGGGKLGDNIRVRLREGHSERVVVRINERDEGEFQYRNSFDARQIDRIVVYGQAGDDHIRIDDDIEVDAVLFGGAGDDHLFGGGGNNVLVGGTGNDHLFAGRRRDLLIGGLDADHLWGGPGDDMLISGTTDYDNNLTAMRRIQSTWMGPELYGRRIEILTDAGFEFSLNGATVHDDGAFDILTGGHGRDWFLANIDGSGIIDLITDRRPGEIITDLN